MPDPAPPNPPLTQATYFILLSLEPGSRHGYAILKDVEDLSEGRVRLSTSTLYSALDRMQAQGLIERIENHSEAASPGLPRKVYRLTACGGAALAAELSRLQQLIRAAEQSPSFGRLS